MNYEEFLASKQFVIAPSGFDCDNISPKLFPFQHDIVRWSLKKGKAAIFAGTGLGKTTMQLSWAKCVHEHSKGDVLILAPLAVTEQTKEEGLKFNVDVNLCRTQNDVLPGVNITNYEMLDHFDTSYFAGIVLDESSILKAFTGKVRTQIIDSFRETPYRLACTATPAPNDHMELGNHSEFLGIMRRPEMLSTYFVHDGKNTSQWRIKGHAVKSFWEWVASWAVMMQLPSDLGYEDNGFRLPPLNMNQIVVDKSGYIVKEAQTLQERRDARRNSLIPRVSEAARLVNSCPGPWLVWCDLNVESDALRKAIPGSVEIRGSDNPEKKVKAAHDFAAGKINCLVSKSSIFGFGLNFQVCNKMVFTGLSDSFEQYYQAIRRCWRFGQTMPVQVHVITSEKEGAIVRNIERKEADFQIMLNGMIASTQEICSKEIRASVRDMDVYEPAMDMRIPAWLKEDATA
jgi:hypothetical protein